MKKFITIALAVIMVFAMVGCNTTRQNTPKTFDPNNPPTTRDANGMPEAISWDATDKIVGQERMPSPVSEMITLRIANTTLEDFNAYVNKLKAVGFTKEGDDPEQTAYDENGYITWVGVYQFATGEIYRVNVTGFEHEQTYRDGQKYNLDILWAASKLNPDLPTPDPNATPTPNPTEVPTEEPTEEPTGEPTVEPTEDVEVTEDPDITEEPDVTDNPDITDNPDDIANTDIPDTTDEP